MSDFELYLKMGLWHIADITAYDHIVFVIALCAGYAIADWRKIALLVTAFTVGHSLTLALSVLNILVFPSKIIELLIPITIMIASIFNTKTNNANTFPRIKYALALFFGFIHGCGFSNYLKSLLSSEENVFLELLSFNIGIEIGQLCVVLCTVLFAVLLKKMFHVEQSKYQTFISGVTFGVALSLFINLLTSNN